jgi:hypothetical protein
MFSSMFIILASYWFHLTTASNLTEISDFIIVPVILVGGLANASGRSSPASLGTGHTPSKPNF